MLGFNQDEYLTSAREIIFMTAAVAHYFLLR